MRNLEREIAKIARKLVKKIDAKEKVNTSLNEKELSNFLGFKNLNMGKLRKKIELVL